MKTRQHSLRAGRILAAVVALCLLAPVAFAELLVQYDFEGETLVASQVHTWITASNFVYSGDGTTAYPAGYNSTDAFRATKWPTGGAVDDYFGFSVVLDPGFVANITNVTFAEQRSPEGPTNYVVRYSVDGSTFHAMGSGSNDTADTFHEIAAREAWPRDVTDALHVRLYGTNATSGDGTWRVDDVSLWGTIAVNAGMRHFKCQDYDNAAHDNWDATTNANGGTVQRSQSMYESGKWSLELNDPADTADPTVVFDNASLAGTTNVTLSVSYAADEPDSNEDLLAAVSYDGGSTWSTNKLVDGFGGLDLPFGSPGEVANPYQVAIGADETQVRLKIVYDNDVSDATDDYYYIDSVYLYGRPTPSSSNAPTVSMYGGYSGVTTNSVDLSGHVTGGYPYPTVTVYYGPTDGFGAEGGWAYSSNLGTHAWGLFTNTLDGLTPGQKYYYRFYVSNSEGANWASSSSNFTTTAGAFGSSQALYLDSIGIASQMPMSVDNDGDGMADAWEIAYFGNTSSNAAVDSDGDGWSNLRESLAGTDPSDSNSYLRIVSVDLASAASDDIDITWWGGDYNGPTGFAAVGDAVARDYEIYSTDTAGGTKTYAGAVSDDVDGTNVWTDSNAVIETDRRYYDIAVSHRGQSYTNTEEWAAYVQQRPVSRTHLVCVPVDLGTNNNLNSTLGQQLARGLHGDNTPSSADWLKRLTDSGAWKEYYLATNASGDVLWWDEDEAAEADLEVTPGMAFWVERRSGSAVRTNTVFAGKSFEDGDMVDMTFNTNYSGWKMFGWPLKQARSHSSSDASTNQLGFADIGSGGTRSTGADNEKGDEIWIWLPNGAGGAGDWRRGIWLIGNKGQDGDGRWWDTHAADYADFSLEPGIGYYYRHRVNQWGGTNFNWRPETP